MKRTDISNVLSILTSNEQLECFNDKVIKFKILKVHKRRLSNVYVVSVTFETLGQTKICIKRLSKIGVSDIEDNKQKLSLLNEFESNKIAYESFQTNNCPYIVVKPLCVLTEQFIIITEFFENSTTLEHLLTKEFDWNNNKQFNHLKELMFESGKLLAIYQNAENQATNSADEKIEDLAPYLMVRINLIYQFFIDKNLTSLLNKSPNDFILELKKIPAHILKSSGEPVKTHGDYTPANILFAKDKLALIDFSESKEASRFYDVGSFVNYIRMLPLNKATYQSGKAEQLINMYLNGYDNQTTDGIILEKIFKFRYLTTNLLTQIYETKESRLKSILLMPRIKRYMIEFERFSL